VDVVVTEASHASLLLPTSSSFTAPKPSSSISISISASATSTITTTTKKPVKKVCLKTGKVLERFESITKAAQSAGVVYQSIHGVVTGYRGRVMCKGHGWRYASSSSSPPPGDDAPPNTEIVSVSTVHLPASSITDVLPKVLPNNNHKGQTCYYIPQSLIRYVRRDI
jgi:hypothetical protein